MARALIPNSTQVPDVILDHWMAELSGAEFKVLMYVARRTYGFGKDSDRISLNQIARGIRRRDGRRLDRGTGLSRSGVKAACNSLIGRGLLVRQANRTEEGQECKESTYRLNLYATPAGVGQKSAHLGRVEAHVGHEDAPGRSASDRGVGQKVTPQETDPQETEQETASAVGGPEGVPDEADAETVHLVEELVAHGVGRSVARELAAEKPAVCRRCLAYLPYAEVRKTPGAWLASAIRDEYGPPPGYLQATKRARQPARLRRREPDRPRGVRIDELRATYHRLETTQPEVLAAFEAFVAAEKRRTERIAAALSPRRRGEHLAAFGSEESRLELFDRWLRGQGTNPARFSARGANAEPVANTPRG
jgi:phage replication O-like protein O